jgi:ubiquinone/menaquinone biosynthesis C-methylase UbiE
VKKYIDRTRNRLVFVSEAATPDFWDRSWQDQNLVASIKAGSRDRFVSHITQKYIRPGKDRRILEGGCGKGQFVYSLARRGYDAVGVDYAKETVRKVNSLMPELQVRFGDVRQLNFPDNYFDGYWSLGVIEHLYDGYGRILDEMTRVIKPGGYLFVTFPHLSRLRTLKAKMGTYPPFDEKKFDKKKFYQFGLDHVLVIQDLQKRGFQLQETRRFDGLKGLKDEVSWLRRPLQALYDSKTLVAQIVCYAISVTFAPFSSHMALLVMKNQKKR